MSLRQFPSLFHTRRRKTTRRWSRQSYRPEQLEVRTLLSATTFTPMAPLPMTIDYTENSGDAAIRTNSGIAATTMTATDDGSTGLVSLGFSIGIGSNTYSSLYINNNGNVTFNAAMSTYTPFGISSATVALLAPFFADVDTRGTGTVTYGQTTVDGHNAFGVTWHNVGYYNRKTNKVDDFQLVIISRTDLGAGDFDFEFNYDGMQWETGDASGGTNGLGGTSARVGFAEGASNKLEFVGSGVNGALLDGGTNSLSAYNFGSVVDGRFRFQVRDGAILSPLALDNSSIAENSAIGTLIGTFEPFDPNTNNIYTYTIVSGNGGTDNASFYMVGDKLYSNTALDFETKSSYSIRVQGVNQHTVGFERILTVNVTNVNETPTDLSLSNSSVAENSAVGTTVGTFSTTDPDASNTFTYTLVSGSGSTDNSSFTISGNQLQTTSSFDYETKQSYSVRIRATDQGGLYYEKTLTINVTNVNETPTNITLSNNTVAEDAAVATTVGTFSSTDPDASNTFTYTLVSGSGSTDNSYFSISSNQLRIAAGLDYDTHPAYSIRIRTTDQGGLFYEKTFTINTTNVNETPTNISLSNSTVAEDAAINSAVGTFSTTDPDASNTFTYTLVSGSGSTDNSYFTISGSQLQVAAALDYDTKPTYSIRVRTTDQGGLYYEKTLTINTTNVNETPTNITLSNNSIAENSAIGTGVGTFSTTDPDASNIFTYTLVSGSGNADNALFTITGNQLQIAAMLDYDLQSTYSIRVRTTDQGNLYYEKTFTINATNVNEAPFNILLSNSTVPENSATGTAVGSLSSWDPDTGNTFTYSLVTGTGSDDNSLFSISGNQLQTAAVFDYESKSSYTVRLRTTDQNNLTYEKAFTISITDVNDAPTDIAISRYAVEENYDQPMVGNLSATDPDTGNTFTYSLVSGSGSTDNAAFYIDAGRLIVLDSFDYETKSSYNIRIRATDQGNLYYEKAFTITVINLDDQPSDVALSSTAINENMPVGTVVGTLTGTDQDAGDTFFYELVSGTGSLDNPWFTIDGDQLKTGIVLDYEGRSTASIRIRISDSHLEFIEKVFTITVNDVPEAPYNVVLSNSSVVENSAIGTTVGTLSAWDPDYHGPFTYALVSGTGSDDNALFTINGDQLQTAAQLDFDARFSYSIRVQTTDETNLTYEKVLTVTTTGVNESPFNLLLSNNSIAENSPVGTNVGTFSAWDPDFGDTFTYSLVSGTGSDDNAQFAISGNQLQTNAAFDYDTRSVYTIRVRTTDGGNLTYESIFYINITNVNENPFALLLSNNSVAENSAVGTNVGTLAAWDPDFGDTFSYTLVSGTGSTDNASFTIAGNQIKTAAVFDYETKASYSIRVRVTDGGNLTYDQTFTILVTNVNDAPIALSQYSFNIADAVRASKIKKKLRDNVVVSVQDLLDGAGGLSPIPSTNPTTTGIAVIGSDNLNGVWQYSSDGGTTWQSLAGTSTSAARLLGTDALISFVPNKKTFFGTVSLTAVAWNQLMGTSGTVADATTRGGMTAFSTNSFQITQVILKV